jgi:gas vesicle protein GvpG
MFILDSLLVGGLRFVLDKLATAADAELHDDTSLREQLLEAQLRFDLGELSDQEFADIERDLLVRIREIKGAKPGASGALTLSSPDVKVVGVDADIAEELREP